MPSSSTRRATVARTPASSSGTTIEPSGPIRSEIPARRRPGARNTGVSGDMKRSYMRERFCRPISSTSSNPSVIRSPMRAPFSSRIALVAMVVPCTKRLMAPGASPLSPSTASTPARTPATRSSGDEGTFAAQTRSPRRPITSVKVPPMSTPIRNPSCDSVTSISKSRLLRDLSAHSVRLGERASDVDPDPESVLRFGHKHLRSRVQCSPLAHSVRPGR